MDEEYVIQDLFKEYRYSLKKIKNKLKKINKFDNLGDSLIKALSEMFNNHFENLLSYYDTYASDERLESLCSRIEKFYIFALNKEKNVSLENRSFYWKVICYAAYGLIKEPENDEIFYVKDFIFKMVEENEVELFFKIFREKPNPFIRNLVREKYDNFDFDNLVSVLECEYGKLLSLFYEISQNKIFRSDKNLLSFLDYRLMISGKDYNVKAIKTNKMTRLSRDYCCVIFLEDLFYLNIEELSIKDKDDEDILYLDGNFVALVRTLFLSQVEKDPSRYIKEHYFDIEDISPYMINLFTALTSSNLSLFSEDQTKLIERARIGILPYYPEMNDWSRS